MIKTKGDLKYYMECDKIALKIPVNRKFPRPVYDVIWKYQRVLRKTEYYHNNQGFINKFFYVLYRTILQNMSNTLGFSIPINVFAPGLSIAHTGTIAVNAAAKVGCNCRIHEGVTIGATNGEKKAATIGDNCFIGSGAKIIGSVTIGDNVAIGAGAVVTKSFFDGDATLGGIPARIISNNNSSCNIVEATRIYQNLKEIDENE